MKDVLERYICSLAEQERATTAPESLQDLGTFVTWLLEERNFQILRGIFRMDGIRRTKQTGDRQNGVDILATGPQNGNSGIFRFVLKKGPVTPVHVGQRDQTGNIFNDVLLAASIGWEDDARLAKLDERSAPIVVVAVHNGQLDPKAVTHVTGLTQLLKREGVELEWWDSTRLAQLAHETLAKNNDGGIFPPSVRPFARLALDSLRREPRHFDVSAVDTLLKEKLHSGDRLASGTDAESTQLLRRAWDVTLFASMVEAEVSLQAPPKPGASTLPVFDTLERTICSIAERIRLLPPGEQGAIKPGSVLAAPLRECLMRYVDTAERLRQRLEPLQNVPLGLATAGVGEHIDYPYRVLRLLGILAVAAHADMDLFDKNSGSATAVRFATTIRDIWNSNPAACGSPVVDDQIIELSLIWSLLLRVGFRDDVRRFATHLVQRSAAKRLLRLPLPALYLSLDGRSELARERALRILVPAHLGNKAEAFQFEDGGSTILPLALYISYKLDPGVVSADDLAAFFPVRVEPSTERKIRRGCFFQCWRPPPDAPEYWYSSTIEQLGTTHVFGFLGPSDRFCKDFEDAATPVHPSIAQRVGLPSLDAVAWKSLRTPPPMRWILEAMENSATPSPVALFSTPQYSIGHQV